jgi:putative flippase GtrA
VARSILSALTSHIPPRQLGRYLLVGVWNTAFAYGTFALFTYLLGHYIPASYMVASVLSSLLNITVSFLGYKWFVFRTQGNYLKEWARSVMVYSGAIALGLLLLPPIVFAVKEITDNQSTAPYIAGAILLAIQVVISFLGHKNFSFRPAGTSKGGPDA